MVNKKSYLPDPDILCPATMMKKSCLSIVSKARCPKYICVVGVNQNTGERVDQWGCNESFREIIAIDNSQQQRQTAAAVESFRNEMIRANDASQQVLIAAIEQAARPHATGRRALVTHMGGPS